MVAKKEISKVNFESFQYENTLSVDTARNSIKKKLKLYSTSSKFEDDRWVLDKVSQNKSDDIKIQFNMYRELGDKICEIQKTYILVYLINGYKVNQHISNRAKSFFSFLVKNKISVRQVSISTFILFENYLDDSISKQTKKKLSHSTKDNYFRHAMNVHTYLYKFPLISKVNLTGIINPYGKDKNIDGGTVVKVEVLEKIDSYIYENETLPLKNRVMYWILRLYGKRVGDVSQYPLECVKKLTKDMVSMYTVIVKNHKGIHENKKELTFINLSIPIEKYLYDLILRQEKHSSLIQDKVVKKGFLFYSKNYNGYKGSDFNEWLRKLQITLKIGKPDSFSVHSLRTTAATMRAENGWSTIQLKWFLNHKGFASIDNYVKPSSVFMEKKQKEIIAFSGNKPQIYFNGKIINSINNELEEKILINPRAHKLPDFGYCPDVSSCGQHFFCLGCDSLIADVALNEYYWEQADREIKRSEQYKVMGEKNKAKDSLHRATLFTKLYLDTSLNKGDLNA